MRIKKTARDELPPMLCVLLELDALHLVTLQFTSFGADGVRPSDGVFRIDHRCHGQDFFVI